MKNSLKVLCTAYIIVLATLLAIPARKLWAQVSIPKVDPAVVARLESLARPGYHALWRRADDQSQHRRQRIAVLISSRDCIGGRDPRFVPALRAALQLLSEEARRDSTAFTATGVALDWEPDSGVVYLRKLADFDQWIVGQNWGNDAAVRLVWRDSTGIPAIPQLIVLERAIGERRTTEGRGGSRPYFGPERVVQRFISANAIANWVLQADSVKPSFPR